MPDNLTDLGGIEDQVNSIRIDRGSMFLHKSFRHEYFSGYCFKQPNLPRLNRKKLGEIVWPLTQ